MSDLMCLIPSGITWPTQQEDNVKRQAPTAVWGRNAATIDISRGCRCRRFDIQALSSAHTELMSLWYKVVDSFGQCHRRLICLPTPPEHWLCYTSSDPPSPVAKACSRPSSCCNNIRCNGPTESDMPSKGIAACSLCTA